MKSFTIFKISISINLVLLSREWNMEHFGNMYRIMP